MEWNDLLWSTRLESIFYVFESSVGNKIPRAQCLFLSFFSSARSNDVGFVIYIDTDGFFRSGYFAILPTPSPLSPPLYPGNLQMCAPPFDTRTHRLQPFPPSYSILAMRRIWSVNEKASKHACMAPPVLRAPCDSQGIVFLALLSQILEASLSSSV